MKESSVPGLVVAGGMLTGTAGLILSLIAFLGGELLGAAIFLLSAAVIFGALANALFRT